MAADSYGPNGEPQFAGSGVPQDAADLTLVGAFAGQVGNRRKGSSSDRNSFLSTGQGQEGLIWGDTTDGNEYRLTGGSWVLLLPQIRDSRTVGGTKNAGVGAGAKYDFETWNFTVPAGRAAVLRLHATALVGKQLDGTIAGTFQPVLNLAAIPGLHYNSQAAPQNTPVTLAAGWALPIIGSGKEMAVNMRITQESASGPATVWDYRFNQTLEY
jgi:hypothetical protein